MKKILFIVFSLVIFLPFLNAECTYKDRKDLNILGSYITYHYEYDESTNTFNLTINNLTEDMKAYYKEDYYPNNGQVIISGLIEGESVSAQIRGTDSSLCAGEAIRTIIVNMPYKNDYYNRSECAGKTLNVCTSKFLDYKMSETQFKNLINKKIEEVHDFNFEEETKKITVEKSFWEKVIDILKELYIPIILIIVSSLITYLIFNKIYLKVKHGF